MGSDAENIVLLTFDMPRLGAALISIFIYTLFLAEPIARYISGVFNQDCMLVITIYLIILYCMCSSLHVCTYVSMLDLSCLLHLFMYPSWFATLIEIEIFWNNRRLARFDLLNAGDREYCLMRGIIRAIAQILLRIYEPTR